MATASQGFIAAALPAQIVRTSATNLFALAAQYLGDPLLWTELARQNGLVDPWIAGYAEIKIPPVVTQSTPTGIYAPTGPTYPA